MRGFECLGACDIAPMASVNGVYVGPIALDEVPTLVEQIREGLPPLPGKQLRPAQVDAIPRRSCMTDRSSSRTSTSPA